MFIIFSHVILTLLASSTLYKLAECSPKRSLSRAMRCFSDTATCVDIKHLALTDEKAVVEGFKHEPAIHFKGGYFRSRSKHAASVRTAKRVFEATFSRAKVDRHFSSRINKNKILDRVRRAEKKFESLKNAFRNARMNQMLYGWIIYIPSNPRY